MNRGLCSRSDNERAGRCRGRAYVKNIVRHGLSMKKVRDSSDKNGCAEPVTLPDGEPLQEAAK